MKRLVYKTFTGLRDLQDFKDSGHPVSRRLEAGVRRLERIRHKLITRFYKEKGYKTRLQPYKVCPICGESKRRAGYFRACPNCYPLLQWRQDVAMVLGQLQSRLESEGVKLTPEFLAYGVRITATLSVQALVRTCPEPEPSKTEIIQFKACQILNKPEADRYNGGLKDLLMKIVLDLYEKVLQAARERVDSNGVIFREGNLVNFPVAGPWKKPDGSVPFPFTRSK